MYFLRFYGFVNRIVQTITYSHFYFQPIRFMQGAIDAFGSGAVAGATATASGPLGTIVYVLLGVTIFFTVGGIIMYAIHRFGGSRK